MTETATLTCDPFEYGRALGRLHYEKLSEDDRVIVKFGMTPITALREVGLVEGYREVDPKACNGFVLGLMDGADKDGGMRA